MNIDDILTCPTLKKVLFIAILSSFIATLGWGFVQIRDIPATHPTRAEVDRKINTLNEYVINRLIRVEDKIDKLLMHTCPFGTESKLMERSDG